MTNALNNVTNQLHAEHFTMHIYLHILSKAIAYVWRQIKISNAFAINIYILDQTPGVVTDTVQEVSRPRLRGTHKKRVGINQEHDNGKIDNVAVQNLPPGLGCDSGQGFEKYVPPITQCKVDTADGTIRTSVTYEDNESYIGQMANNVVINPHLGVSTS